MHSHDGPADDVFQYAFCASVSRGTVRKRE